MAYVRKTRDEYQIHGYYGREHGWEEVTCADTRHEARRLLAEYRANERFIFKMVKKRIMDVFPFPSAT